MDEMEIYNQRPAGSGLFSTSESFMDSIKDLDFMTDVSEDKLEKIEGGQNKGQPTVIDPKDFGGTGEPIILNEVDLQGLAIAKDGGTAIVDQDVIINQIFLVSPDFFKKRAGTTT
ncbi:hypothetical protein BJP34_17365 [Moorena producens PAL-8-15-08-1]|uniref:Uncharacterized protein n=3 Tax=Moorena TaxID=1155738 RepID=A0A1D8TTN6_9CYAN|nr:hypothetical protein BJP34_17365 [Moorena producens PAL-8-15-08-1]